MVSFGGCFYEKEVGMKRAIVVFLTTAAITLRLAGTVAAQDQDELNKLKARIEALEKKGAEQGKGGETKLPAWLDRITVEGVAFFRYSRELDETAKDYNEFDIDRAYLSIWSQLWDKGKIRYTMEGGDLRENGTDNFDITTKHLYLEVSDLLFKSDYLKIGQGDVPWVPYEEAIWNYRLQGTIFADRSGYLTSTDLGVSYGGKFPNEYGSFQASLVNGEGWKKNETGKHKDAQLRVTLNPFAESGNELKNLFIAGYGGVGAYEHDADITGGEPDERDRLIGQIGYKESEKLTLVGEILRAKDPADKMKSRHPSLAARANQRADAEGYSIFGVLNLNLLGLCNDREFAKRWEVIGRWDRLDPDDSIDDNSLDRFIGGISYKWNKYIRTLLDVEHVDFEAGAGKEDESRVMLQAEVKF